MTWAKFDDSFPEHPKIDQLTDGAFRLHVSAICHCARWNTDGRVANGLPRRLMPDYRPRYLHELAAGGLWRYTDDGWLILPVPRAAALSTDLDRRGPLDVLWDAHETLHRRSHSARMRGRLDKPRVLKRLVARDGWACRYCTIGLGPELDDTRPVIEHLTPLSRGGTNDLDNLGLACGPCNNEKGTMTEPEYLAYLAARR